MSRRRPAPTTLLVAVSAVITLLVTVLPLPRGSAVHGADALAKAVAERRCVMSDTPVVLIRLGVLSRDLTAGCPNWIDVTGRTYGPDRGPTPRTRNARWQRDLQRYLLSGDAVVIGRSSGTGISTRTWHAIRRGGVLARAGGHTIYRSPGSGQRDRKG